MANTNSYPILMTLAEKNIEPLVEQSWTSSIPISKNNLLATMLYAYQETDKELPGLRQKNFYDWSYASSDNLIKICWPRVYINDFINTRGGFNPKEDDLKGAITSTIFSFLARESLSNDIKDSVENSLTLILKLSNDFIAQKIEAQLDFSIASSNYMLTETNNTFILSNLVYYFHVRSFPPSHNMEFDSKGFFSKSTFDLEMFKKNQTFLDEIARNIDSYVEKMPL